MRNCTESHFSAAIPEEKAASRSLASVEENIGMRVPFPEPPPSRPMPQTCCCSPSFVYWFLSAFQESCRPPQHLQFYTVSETTSKNASHPPEPGAGAVGRHMISPFQPSPLPRPRTKNHTKQKEVRSWHSTNRDITYFTHFPPINRLSAFHPIQEWSGTPWILVSIPASKDLLSTS